MEPKSADEAVQTARTAQPLSNLAAAYVAAWGAIDNVVKNAANPHFGSNYADLGAVLDTVRPVFAAHKLALMTAPGEMVGDQMTLMWMLIHASGELISGKMSLPIGNKPTAQAGGSCLTYMRRYLNASVGGIAQVDDDGNAASATQKAPREKVSPAEYAGAQCDLKAKIAAAGSVAELDALKPAIAELGDQKVADAFTSRKRELKAAK